MPAIQRTVSSTLDFRNAHQNLPVYRSDRINKNKHQTDLAVQNAVGSMGILIQLVNEELEIVRRTIRERGVRMRRFIRESLHLNLESILRRISRFLLRLRCRIPVVLEGNAAISMEQNLMEYRELSNPKPSLLDLAKVLMHDEVEDGVLRSFQLHSTPWDSLPIRKKEGIETTESISEFQLFNHPMSMEDDDERLSLPSTLQTDAEQKITSLETQLAALTRQMQNIMAAKTVETCSPGSSISSDAGIHLPTLSTVSDDEMGRSQYKKLDALNKENVLPVICPPLGPPPPPPPFFFNGPMKSSTFNQNKPNRLTPSPLIIKNDSAEVEEKKSVVRPSMMDIRAVQLRKTNTARSPGGTPMPLGRRPLGETRDGQSMNGVEFLANALRNKFRSVQTSFCDDEDGNSSWAENDDD